MASISRNTDIAPAEWDAEVLALGGHLLQSSRWGTFKDGFGWTSRRIRSESPSGIALVQVLFKQRGPLSVGYVPRGPIVSLPSPVLLQEAMDAVDDLSRSMRAIFTVIEPEQQAPWTSVPSLLPGPAAVQPLRTVKVLLDDDDSILSRMHQKTRYNTRLALRKGITVHPEPADGDGFNAFYRLMQETSTRNAFAIHSDAYYRGVLTTFGDDAALMVARTDNGIPVAALVVVRFGDEAVYLYGASTSDAEHRTMHPGFALQFETMRWARERGCRLYDLWGIPEHDPDTTTTDEGNRLAPTRGDDWRGLFEFKTRFGGEIVSYPKPLQRDYVPVLPGLVRRIFRSGG